MTLESARGLLKSKSAERKYSTSAQYIKNKLIQIPKSTDLYKRRWFWELLQNACDYGEDVIIEVGLNDETLIVRHNGADFTADQALNLIISDTDKDEIKDPKIIGQYGTGFLATHVLSTNITVEGRLRIESNIHDFKFELDRSDLDRKAEIARKLQDSENQLFELLNQETPKWWSTSYTYHLDKQFEFLTEDKIAFEAVFEDLEEIVSYVFVFQSKLKEVRFLYNNKTVRFNRNEASESKSLISINKRQTVNDGETLIEELNFLTSGSNDLKLAIRFDPKSKAIIPVSSKFPKLFKVYPLIGSHNFPFPVVFSSNLLDPYNEREGIPLGSNQTINRGVIESAAGLFRQLLINLGRQEIMSLYNLCKLKTEGIEDEELSWYKSKIYPQLRDAILKDVKVKSFDGEWRAIQNLYFPNMNDDDFSTYFDVASGTKLNVPNKTEAIQWKEALDFSVFKAQNLNMDNLLLLRSKYSPKSEFLMEPGEIDNWSKRLIRIIIKTDKIDHFSKYQLILTQSRLWSNNRNSTLFWDDSINESYKDLLKKLGVNIFNQLVSKDYGEFGESILELKKNKTNSDVLEAIDQGFRKRSKGAFDEIFRELFKEMHQLSEELGIEASKEHLPIFWELKDKIQLEIMTPEMINDSLMFSNSGKSKELLRLASGPLTKEQLSELAENQELAKDYLSQISTPENKRKLEKGLELSSLLTEDQIKQLGELKEANLIDKALQDASDEIKRKRRKADDLKIGSEVEDMVEELIRTELDSDFIQVAGRDSDSWDLYVRNTKNQKKVFIEIKSHGHSSSKPSKLYIKQAQTAVDSIQDKNYFLGVVKKTKDWDQVNQSHHIKANMKFTLDIGTKLLEVVKDFNGMEKGKVNQGVGVEFDREKFRFTISQSETEKGINFHQLKHYIKSALLD
jgi:hypothetical protein